jgi:hypothetical protein
MIGAPSSRDRLIDRGARDREPAQVSLNAMSAEQAKPNGNGGKTGTTALESAAKQAEVVKLRMAGVTLDEIATRVGLAGRSGAHYHVTKWVESLQPSSEMAEEYRQTQLARAEERYHRFRPLAMGEVDEATGEWKREPDWQAVNAIQRDGERMARMLGADLERNVSVNLLPSAEQFAAVMGWDTDGEAIDAVAEELPDDDVPELRPTT